MTCDNISEPGSSPPPDERTHASVRYVRRVSESELTISHSCQSTILDRRHDHDGKLSANPICAKYLEANRIVDVFVMLNLGLAKHFVRLRPTSSRPCSLSAARHSQRHTCHALSPLTQIIDLAISWKFTLNASESMKNRRNRDEMKPTSSPELEYQMHATLISRLL